MNSSNAKRNGLLGQKVVSSLRTRRFDAFYFETKEEAYDKVLELIPDNAVVSWGGSTTMEQIGVIDFIRSGGRKCIDRDTARNLEERFSLMREALSCDVFLTSFNALSEDGVLINIDNVGNRVAAIAFGPKNVIAVVGMNKVCKTVAAAMERARNFAAPVNVQRCNDDSHFPKIEHTACSRTGSCGNCKADDCICSTIVATRMCKVPERIKVILVGEDLGF